MPRSLSRASFCALIFAACLVLTGTVQAQNWVVSGQVTAPGGGGIANVDLDVFATSTGDEVLGLTGDLTAANGTFSMTILEAIPVGTYEIHFSPSDPQDAYFPTVIQIFLAGSTTAGTVTLDPGVFLSGQVVNESGVGLPEVDIDVIDEFGDPVEVLSDFTDGAGNFQVLAPLGLFDLEFSPTAGTLGGPFVPVLLRSVVLDQSLDLGTLEFANGYSLTGTVQTSSGTAVSGADIDVSDPITGARIHTPGDNTDASGNFDVLVPSGSWIVEIDPPQGALLVSVEVEFTVMPVPVNNLGIVTLQSGFPVSGRTVDGSATPVPDVDLDFVIESSGIEIPTAHDNADSAGNFSVVVPSDTYTVIFRPPFVSGFAPKTVPGIAVTGSVALGDVVLDAGFIVSGTVTAQGSPVANVEITMVDSTTGAPFAVFGGDSDPLGQYAFRQVPGTFDITYTPPVGSGLSSLTEFDVVIASDTTLDIELDPSPPTDNFIRGDANQDLGVNLADAVAVLEALFAGGALLCPDAADANDDSGVDISDAIFILSYLFAGGATPPPPFGAPGPDPTPDGLSCS